MEHVLDHRQDLTRPVAAPARAEDLLAACYEDMRRVARAIMAHDGMRARLQPTDLANEAALRLIQSMPGQVSDRGHMLAVAGRTMRRVLIDEARRYRAAKRIRPPLTTQFPGGGGGVVDIEDLDRALVALELFSAEHARVVELRFSLGLTVEETAAATGLPERTVKRRWQAARAWLVDYLAPSLKQQTLGHPVGEVDRRALALFERLSDRPGDERYRKRLLAKESEAVLARVAALERGSAAGPRAMPTDLPGGASVRRRPPPEQVGPFRLTELLGEGGMGQVWKGARNDGLFDQVVAVKLVHAHLALLAAGRFAEERRILARLEHPNIARLIDGGVLEDETPFLVMEYIDGRPIDTVAAELPEAARVGLFLQAADAAQFAHGLLIVHADLKPSNIVVDTGGRVRLLDFGIARLLGDEADGELLPMTRDYASPARLAGAAPVVADDVFALGLVLRDLVGPSRDADLLAIADKARAEDAEARYGSVGALIADLGRWRDGLPVQARPDSVGYRMRKFVRRHHWGVAMTAAALVALTTTSVVATASYVRAERAQAEAKARFDQVRGTARYLLFDLGDRLERQPQSLALRADVARVSQTYLDALSRSPDAPMAVRAESAQGLLRLAERQGAPGRPNLGQTDKAKKNLVTAYELARTIPGPEGRRLRAETRLDQAHLTVMVDNDFPATDRLLADARSLIFDPRAPMPDLQRRWYGEMSALRQWQGRYEESLTAARQGWPAPRPRDPRDALLAEANLHDLLAETTYYAGRPRDAVAPYRQRMALLEDAVRRWPGDPQATRLLPRSRWALGLTLLDVNRAKEAAPILAKGVAEARAVADFDTSDADAERAAEMLDDAQAQNFAGLGQPQAAIPILAHAVERRRQRMVAQPQVTMHARDYMVALIALGDVELRPGGERRPVRITTRARRSWSIFAAPRYAALDDSASTKLLAESRKRWCQGKAPALL